jgi:hypothetical protein
MEKGFFRHLSGTIAWLSLLFGLVGSFPAADRSRCLQTGNPSWWEVRLVVGARGKYTIRGGEAPVEGEFVCRARWEGRLQPDDDDFLLLHLKTEILEWRLRETSGPAGRESVLEEPPGRRPSLRVFYVLKEGREVEFFFELGGILIPVHISALAVALELPRSSGRADGLPDCGYGEFVCRGSSRVAIPEADLLERNPERSFSWEWQRENRYVVGGRVFDVTQRHAAEAAVTLVAH